MNLRITLLVALGLSGLTFSGRCQRPAGEKELPRDWHLLRRDKDGYAGIGMYQAYEFVRSKGLVGRSVVVAVIDMGVDTAHDELRDRLWNNRGEVVANGRDDDKNGYADDIHGWNFLGNPKGQNVGLDSYEFLRIYHGWKAKYTGLSLSPSASALERYDYDTWKRAGEFVSNFDVPDSTHLGIIKCTLGWAKELDQQLRSVMDKKAFTRRDLDTLMQESASKALPGRLFQQLFALADTGLHTDGEVLSWLTRTIDEDQQKLRMKETPPYPYRKNVVGDDENDIRDSSYGNPNMVGPNPFHGTHVAGIVAGIARDARLMVLRAIPDGDEHDKDVALAIRYAVNNGARVINMSFSKHFSPQKQWVDEAIRYAEKRGVLVVHAAGNDAKDVDVQPSYPSSNPISGGGRFANMITVGASGPRIDETLVAFFSNYGRNVVDLFAPGENIYSTIPHNGHGFDMGTSMACPMVTGAVAFLESYFPTLTAVEIKACLLKSVYVPNGLQVRRPGGTNELVELSDLSATGGILDLYAAAKRAYVLTQAKSRK